MALSTHARCLGIALLTGRLSLGCGQGTGSRDDDTNLTPSGPGPATPANPPAVSFPLQDENGCVPGQMTQMGELKGQYGSTFATVNGQNYLLQVNEWNSTEPQTISYGGDHFFRITQQEGSAPTNGGPTGYPSMFIGANGGRTTSNSNLPKQVSALTTVPTAWQWSDGGTLADTQTHSYNVSYDVWFSAGPEGDPTAYGPSGGYLMVWLYDPPDAQPIGSVQHSDIAVENVPGTWDAWVGTNGDRPIISYVSRTPILSLAFDLNDFIRDAVDNRPNSVNPAWYLTNVFIGFEIWRGGVGLETTTFCVVVN